MRRMRITVEVDLDLPARRAAVRSTAAHPGRPAQWRKDFDAQVREMVLGRAFDGGSIVYVGTEEVVAHAANAVHGLPGQTDIEEFIKENKHGTKQD